MGGGDDNKVEPTAHERALANVAAKEWNRYQEVFVPVENKYIEDAHSQGDQIHYDTAKGDVNLAYNKEFGEAEQQLEKGLAQAGVDPTSGKAATAKNDLIDTKLAGETQAAAQAENDVTQRYTDSLGNVLAMGKGQQTESVNSMNSLATAAANKANTEAIDKANEISVPGAVAGVAGSIAAKNTDWFKSSNPSLGDANHPTNDNNNPYSGR